MACAKRLSVKFRALISINQREIMVTHFKRSKEMMAAISAMVATGAQGFMFRSLIDGLGQYVSRGKGGKHKAKSRFGSAFSAHRKVQNNSSKPHSRARECARRVQQMSGEKLPGKPRRMWLVLIDYRGEVGELFTGKITSCRPVIRNHSANFKCSVELI